MNRPSIPQLAALAAALLTILSQSGCALGTTRVAVTHSPLPAPEHVRSGTLLVREFTDGQPADRRGPHIGTKRNGYGMPLGHIGVKGGETKEAALTRCFADALRAAGYKVDVKKADAPAEGKYAAVVDGEIRKFWMDLAMIVWDNVDIVVTLRDRNGQGQLWQREITGNKKHVLWLGVTSEYERVIRDALDEALAKAVKEFSSQEFARHVH